MAAHKFIEKNQNMTKRNSDALGGTHSVSSLPPSPSEPFDLYSGKKYKLLASVRNETSAFCLDGGFTLSGHTEVFMKNFVGRCFVLG